MICVEWPEEKRPPYEKIMEFLATKDAEISHLSSELAASRERERALERERDEAQAEVARYWTSADIKPWVDLAEGKGLGHFGKKLKGMFSRAMAAEEQSRLSWQAEEAAVSRAEAAEAEVKRLRAALEPSAETKAAYIGEFSFDRRYMNDAGNEMTESIVVPWTTIKEIMKAIRARALANANTQGGDDEAE